ncbi:MAG: hypothetical protein ABJZ55_16120 [Fuerstiella sp.]
MPKPATYSRNELSKLFGVVSATVGKWEREEGFPEPDKDNRFVGTEVAAWWFQHRATKSSRMQLVHSPGDLDAEMTLADEDRLLDLRIKAHKVAKTVGDAVSFEDIRHVIGEFAADIRESCSAAQAATGQDLTPLFDEAFTNFEQRVRSELESLEATR